MSQVQFHIQAAFGRRHDAFELAGHDHPLALLTIADEIRLQIVGAVELLIARNYGAGVVEGLEVGVGEDARSGGVSARAKNVAGVDEVLIGEHVVSGGLRIAARSDAVGQVGEEAPVLRVHHRAADFVPVRMDVDEAGDDCFPTAMMRLSLTTMSAFSRTSSPRIVMTRAPRSTADPEGLWRGNCMFTAISSG